MRAVAMAWAASLGLGLFCTSTPVSAQDTPTNLVSEYADFQLSSGWLANPTDEFAVVFSQPVRIAQAAWVRLYFGEVSLEPGSFIRLTSMEDRASADMYFEDIEEWSHSTAYYNGDTVLLELVAAPHTDRNRVTVRETESQPLIGGNDISRGGGGQCGICGGSDDRVQVDNDWSCRLLPAGCTATIYNENSCLVSAGHCIGGNMVVQFRVPNSSGNCNLNHPGPQDQFPVTNQAFTNGGVGNDWAVMNSGTNSQGLSIYERYGVYVPISDEPISTTDFCEMYGYGVDTTCVRSQTLQFADGGVNQVQSAFFTYSIDLRGGNSGSALIRDGEIVGIATHCPCPNIATRMDFGPFENAIEAICQTPNNDDCGSATQIGLGDTFVNTGSATTDGPAEDDCGVGQIYRDVWYKFVADCDGQATISMCDANYDAAIAVYFVSCPSGENMALACDATSCNGQPSVTLDVQAGFQYRVRVGSLGGGTGSGMMSISCAVVSPDNDNCADAITVGDGVTAYTTLGATTDGPLEPGCGLEFENDIADDVWYHYVATGTGTVTVDSCNSDFNNTLAAYEGACPSGADEAIACDENSCGTSKALMTFSVVEGEDYFIRVGGKNGQEGSGDLDISFEIGSDPCEGDTNGDDLVDVTDLLSLLAAWGDCPGGCAEDFNGDETVDVSDLLLMLAAWGPCEG